MVKRRRALWVTGLLVLALPLAAMAQRGGFFGDDGRFTVARVRYLRSNSWSADYPMMEEHLSQMLENITSIDTHVEGSNVHTLDDPDLMKIPLVYLTEPGYWYPSESEV